VTKVIPTPPSWQAFPIPTQQLLGHVTFGEFLTDACQAATVDLFRPSSSAARPEGEKAEPQPDQAANLET
jgi:hypothetical protein